MSHSISEVTAEFSSVQPNTPQDMLVLGTKLRTGTDAISPNSAAAFTFIQQAAIQGNLSQAHIALGEMHLAGEGTPRNPKEAMNSFARGVNAGDPSGNLKLADMFLEGNGVPQSDRYGFRFTAASVLENLAEGQFRLGGMFEKGLGTSIQPEMAAEMYRSAADQGHKGALVKLGQSPAPVLAAPAKTF